MFNSKHICVTGLAFGDEAKGSVVEYCVRKTGSKLVVRHNGGAQAAHHLVLKNGMSHCFAQFGCGTFAGARTLLSRHVLVNPYTLGNEASALEEKGIVNPLRLVYVERGALLTTPFHMIANKLREISRGDGRHGSCGMGIGETVQDSIDNPQDALIAGDIENPGVFQQKLRMVQDRKIQQMRSLTFPEDGRDAAHLMRQLEDLRAVVNAFQYMSPLRSCFLVDQRFLAAELAKGPVVFEGAQGVLLDQDHGFHPHTTWSKTTAENAIELLGGRNDVSIVGVTRSFTTRHGDGPFVTESAQCAHLVTSDHNKTGTWQGSFRAGWLDLVALKYAAEIVKPDVIAVTHMDMVSKAITTCQRYFQENPDESVFTMAHGGLAKNTNYVRGIKPNNGTPSVDRQQKITEGLCRSSPVCSTFNSVDELRSQISTACSAHIRIESYGPTFDDKRITE